MIRLQNKQNVTAPDANYSYGQIKNNTGSNDGTPWDKAFGEDYIQFFERLMALNKDGVVANGLPDNDTNTYQLYLALLGTKKYKVYTARLSQVATGNPTEDAILENQIGDFIWTRTGVGTYTATITGAFTNAAKFWAIISGSATGQMRIERVDANTAQIVTANDSGVASDNILSATGIEIRVYD